MIRLASKLVCFCILCFSFNQLITFSDSLCTVASKLGLLFLTLAASWHSISYFWARHFSMQKNRTSPHSKCVLITGCDTGFGHQTAITLCDAGFTVFAGCLNDKCQESQQLLEQCKNSAKMHILKLDVTKTCDIMEARKRIEKHCETTGEIFHGLVNNAGISYVGAIEWGRVEDVQTVLNVNLYGAIEVTRQFTPLLHKNPDTRIVVMTSYITAAASPLMASYGISKVALKAFFTSFREEIKRETEKVSGIKTIIVEPTIFKTQMLGFDGMIKNLDKMWLSSTPEVREAYTNAFFDAVVTFIQLWKVFEYFDFIALRRDVSFVSETILKALTTESPEKNHRVIGVMGRAGLSVATSYVPQEAIEVFYQVSTLALISFAVFLKWFKEKYESVTGRKFPLESSDDRKTASS